MPLTKTEKKRPLSAFVEPDVIDRLDAAARQNHRTRSGELRVALERHLSREQREAAAAARGHP